MGRRLAVLAASLLIGVLLTAGPPLLSPAEAALPQDAERVWSSPGDTVAGTHYDCQTNGSTGTRIVKDYLGGLHFTWMNGIGFWQGNRWIYYNFLDENGLWAWPKLGTQVNSYQGAGYPQIDVLADGRGAIGYHGGVGGDPTLAIDVDRGLGCFTEYTGPEDYGSWPYLAVDRSNRAHLVYYDWQDDPGDQLYLNYARFHEGAWSDPEVVDSLKDLSAAIVSSDVSDRVTIAYTTCDPDDPDQIVDVYYIESEDGTNWNWQEKVNITNYQPEDTIRASTDLDAVYDSRDKLHIVWNTPIWSLPPEEAWGRCLLWHWSEAGGITLVADGSWNSHPPYGNLTISKMSISVDVEDNLFAVWSQFDSVDVSAGGYSNGEIYMSYSTDGGETWSAPENLTDSPTPGCWPGECDCDIFPSLAEETDEYLHIVYVNDKDAGCVAQSEGVDTHNPVLYLKVENPASHADVEGSQWAEPVVTSLLQNYPNPFNATTEITYRLEADATVKLEVFNLLGEKVETLIDEYQGAGQRSVIWDASDFPSGVYFCRLAAGGFSDTGRMILLK